jgi:hypothetical protein
MTPEIQRKYAHLVLETTPGPHNHMMRELAELAAQHRAAKRASEADVEDLPVVYGDWHAAWNNEWGCSTVIGLDFAELPKG